MRPRLLKNGPMSIVKINVLTVPEEQRETLEKRFANRAGTVDGSDGFEWFELLRPVEGTDTYLVYTRWRAEEDFQNWMSGMGQAAHRGGPGAGPRRDPHRVPRRVSGRSPPRRTRRCGRSRWCSRRGPRRADQRLRPDCPILAVGS